MNKSIEDIVTKKLAIKEILYIDGKIFLNEKSNYNLGEYLKTSENQISTKSTLTDKYNGKYIFIK